MLIQSIVLFSCEDSFFRTTKTIFFISAFKRLQQDRQFFRMTLSEIFYYGSLTTFKFIVIIITVVKHLQKDIHRRNEISLSNDLLCVKSSSNLFHKLKEIISTILEARE